MPYLPHRDRARYTLFGTVGVMTLLMLIAAFRSEDLLALAKGAAAPLMSAYEQVPLFTLVAFALTYATAQALALPATFLLTLLAGATFGTAIGAPLVAFASASGCLAAFLVARRLLARAPEAAHSRATLLLPSRLAKNLDERVESHPYATALSLRFVGVVPYFAVNIALASTPLAARTFFLTTLVGMLPSHILYVLAGNGLARADRLADIGSPTILAGFLLTGTILWLVTRRSGQVPEAARRARAAD